MHKLRMVVRLEKNPHFWVIANYSKFGENIFESVESYMRAYDEKDYVYVGELLSKLSSYENNKLIKIFNECNNHKRIKSVDDGLIFDYELRMQDGSTDKERVEPFLINLGDD